MEQNPLPPSFIETIPWAAGSSIWPSSTLVLRRNLAGYCFPSKMSAPEGKQVLQLLKNALQNVPEIQQPLVFHDETLAPHVRDWMHEHFLLVGGLQESPNGAAFILDKSSYLLASINRGNHLELFYLDREANLIKAWSLLSKIDNTLEQAIQWAFSQKFGYLTADPSHAGTGFSIYAHLHLPAQVHCGKLDESLAKQTDENIAAIGVANESPHLAGDLVVLQNRFCIGVTEDGILRDLQNMAMKLIAAEKTTRSRLKQEASAQMKDLISKSYGLLFHSYQLEAKEALDLLSIVKLGLQLDWITGIDENKMNELFFKCRRGHLSHILPQPIDLKDLNHRRAEFLHQQLKELKLHI